MALVLVEGFDLLTTGLVASAYPLGAQFSPSMDAGRFGGQSYNPGTSNQNGIFAVATGAVTQCALGIAVLVPSGAFTGLGTGVALLRFMDSGGNRQASIQITNTGAIRATSGVSTILGTSAAGVWSADVFHYLEVEFVLSDTVGVFKVWVDGVQVFNLTNVDTKGQTAATFTELQFTLSGSGAGGTRFDDFYLCDTAARLGEARVETIRPVSDTADKDWVPNSGTTNYTQVDDTVSDGDTTYVAAATVGDLDFYALANLSEAPSTIWGVAPTMIARKDDVASRGLSMSINSGGSIATGSTKAMTAGYAMTRDIYQLDPNGGGAWTGTAVDALLLGIEVEV